MTDIAGKNLHIVTNGGSTYAKAYLNGVEVEQGDYDVVSERMLKRLGVSLTVDRDDMSLPVEARPPLREAYTGPTYDTSLDPISPDFDARTWEAPAKPNEGSLPFTCRVRVPEQPLGHRLSGSRCQEPAVVLIVSENYLEDEYIVYPVCADHAPEEVHETRCSMAEDEYRLISLPVEDDYPEVPTPETWPAGTRLHAGDSWGTVDEWQGRTVWRIKWDNGASFTGAACSGYGKGN